MAGLTNNNLRLLDLFWIVVSEIVIFRHWTHLLYKNILNLLFLSHNIHGKYKNSHRRFVR